MATSPLDYPFGKELIRGMVTDDRGAPCRMVIEAVTHQGARGRIVVPYSNSDKVSVTIEDPASR